LVESYQENAVSDVPAMQRHDRGSLTYADTFENPLSATAIRAMEWMTGKYTILRAVRRFEKVTPAPVGQEFWGAALKVMGIDLTTPAAQFNNIPKSGPVVVVANHPHGMVDGMILAELIGRVRRDYKILTRSLLTGIDETAGSFMIPVPFAHDKDAQKKGLEMRARAMAELKAGGVVALFPSGVVAASDTMSGPAVEAEWNVFTAKMIRRSGAAVVPIHFLGANSRWYQIANRLSPLLRQGLLLHEIAHGFNKPQGPVIGPAFDRDEVDARIGEPREFMKWLRAQTLEL
jgi:acyltransferase-like protein